MSHLIESRGLVKRFQSREIIKGIDLDIRRGEVVALIGTNGAGKSTTIALLMGIIKPDSGKVAAWREDYQKFVGLQLQATPFFEGFTAEENLELFAAFYGIKLSKSQIDDKLAECGLAEAGKTPAVRLSLGQQKRLAIAITTIHKPELIVLDEPTAGLDPLARYEIRKMIQQFADNRTTVLFSSHDMDEVMQIAHRLIFMHKGEILAQGKAEELLAQHGADHLEALYLELTQKSLAKG